MRPLSCPVEGCGWIVYDRIGLSKREHRSRVLAHIHTHWFKQFTLPVFIWRRDSKRWKK